MPTKGLWQIEAHFRILKHDLKIRPIYHFTPRRIEAHIAICFAAFGLLRLLMFRLQRSPEVTSDARLLELVAQCRHTLLEHGVSGERYVVAQKPEANSQNDLQGPSRSPRSNTR